MRKTNEAWEKCTHSFVPPVVYCQREKVIEKTFLIVSAGAQKRWRSEEQRVLGVLYHNIYQIQKINFQ